MNALCNDSSDHVHSLLPDMHIYAHVMLKISSSQSSVDCRKTVCFVQNRCSRKHASRHYACPPALTEGQEVRRSWLDLNVVRMDLVGGSLQLTVYRFVMADNWSCREGAGLRARRGTSAAPPGYSNWPVTVGFAGDDLPKFLTSTFQEYGSTCSVPLSLPS